jgi:ankyrin repeat protein
VVELLIAQGANVNERGLSRELTPLHSAAHGGHASVAGLLIAKGADVSASDKTGATPLHVAAKAGRNEVAKLLIARGARIDAKDERGITPLYLAAQNGRMAVVELLIASGANVNMKNHYDLTPLDAADSALPGYEEIRELLRRHGAKD